METTLTKQNTTLSFTKEQEQLIKSQIAPDATTDELALFLYVAKRSGLDPLSRQIYCIHRYSKMGKKMTIQTSIDGFRVIAERSGNYAGQGEPIFVNDENGKPKIAKVSVFRFAPNGTRYEASVGVAFWDEYVQIGKDGQPMGLWGKMPHTMLSKVAEALALRKAYPQDLSGLYTGEEMAQADVTNTDAIKSTEIVSEKSADELKAEYKVLLNEYQEVSDQYNAARGLAWEDYSKYDPDNWKMEQNAKNFTLAIERLKTLTANLKNTA